MDSSLSGIGAQWLRCLPSSFIFFLLDLKLVESRRKRSSADIDAVEGVFAVVFRD